MIKTRIFKIFYRTIKPFWFLFSLIFFSLFISFEAVSQINPDASAPAPDSVSTEFMSKGSVIMTRGEIVTIRMEDRNHPVEKGDMVELSFSADGEVISVGSWRVNDIKGEGVIEAEPVRVIATPSIGLDALIYIPFQRSSVRALKPQPSEKKEAETYEQTLQTRQEKTPVKKEPERKSIDEALAPYSKIPVPLDFSAQGKTLKWEKGTIRVYSDKIEMAASGNTRWENCIFKVSDELFDDFYMTFKISVVTGSHHNFHAGLVYGKKPVKIPDTDSIRSNILAFSGKASTGLLKSTQLYISRVGTNYPLKERNDETLGNFLAGDNNPTPGVIALMKKGSKCRVYWNGEEIESWEEQTILDGHLWVEFMAYGRGKITATFEDIKVYRLH